MFSNENITFSIASIFNASIFLLLVAIVSFKEAISSSFSARRFFNDRISSSRAEGEDVGNGEVGVSWVGTTRVEVAVTQVEEHDSCLFFGLGLDFAGLALMTDFAASYFAFAML